MVFPPDRKAYGAIRVPLAKGWPEFASARLPLTCPSLTDEHVTSQSLLPAGMTEGAGLIQPFLRGAMMPRTVQW